MSNLVIDKLFDYFDLYLNQVVNDTSLLTNHRNDANVCYDQRGVDGSSHPSDVTSLFEYDTLNSNISSAITLYETEILKISEINSQMDSLKHKYKKTNQWLNNMNSEIDSFRSFTTKYFEESIPSLYSDVITQVNTIDFHLKVCEKIINDYVQNTIEDKKNRYTTAKNCVKSLDKVFSVLKYNKYVCPICVSREISMFVVPCGHTYCKICAAKMNTGCFTCRQPIIKVSPLFFDE